MRCFVPVWVAAVLLLAGTGAGAADAPSPAAPGTAAMPGASAGADAFADNACVQCHRDLAGRSAEIVNLEWSHSVHYANKVGCDGCHGGNAALRRDQFASDDAFKRAAHLERNPEFLLLNRDKEFVSAARGRSVSYFCGKCHAKIKEQHLGSPHGEFGDPTCLYCHGQGTHRIVPASLAIIDIRGRSEQGRCSPCHRSGTMKAVARIKQTLSDTEERIRVSGEQYKQLEEWGYKNLELEKLHHHAAEVRSQLRQIFHSFNMRDITSFAAEIQGVADRTEASYQLVQRLRQTQRRQAMMGAGATLLLLSFAGVLVYYKHRFLDPAHHSPTVARRQPAAAERSRLPEECRT